MSTVAYGLLSTSRGTTARGDTENPPSGVKTFVDALAALVPAEVLVAHALILSTATEVGKNANGEVVTTITSPDTLRWVFWALIGLSMTLYLFAKRRSLERWDAVRVLIPPLAFVGWTMLQKATAFDAVAPDVGATSRFAISIIGAVVLGAVATALAYKAEQQPR